MKHQLEPVELPARLEVASSPVDGAKLHVLGSGDVAFQKIVDRVKHAERSVDIRAFLWRDDEAGNQMGEAVLAAADRGAKVTIHKDKIAAVYEYTGGNKQSFFHKRVDATRGFQAWFLGLVYRAPGSFKQKPNALSAQVLAHPNIRVEHLRKRFDHSKVYIVDDRYLMLGSMGIGAPGKRSANCSTPPSADRSSRTYLAGQSVLASASSSPALLRAMPHWFHMIMPSSRWNESTLRLPRTPSSRSVTLRTSPSTALKAGVPVSSFSPMCFER